MCQHRRAANAMNSNGEDTFCPPNSSGKVEVSKCRLTTVRGELQTCERSQSRASEGLWVAVSNG
jgi:hypothetical protein